MDWLLAFRWDATRVRRSNDYAAPVPFRQAESVTIDVSGELLVDKSGGAWMAHQ
jgi:hypothetical protein